MSFNLKVNGFNHYIGTLFPMIVHSWIHVCSTVRLNQGKIDFAVNGKLIENTLKLETDDKEALMLNKVTLGSKENGIRSFIGNLNLYTSRTKEELRVLTTQSCWSDGDLLGWQEMKFDTPGAWPVDKEAAEVCSALKDRLVTVPTPMTYQQASYVCQRMRASLYFPQNLIYSKTFSDYHWAHLDWSMPEENLCKHYWTPFSWNNADLIDQRTGLKASYVPWYPGEPSKGTGADCIKMNSQDGEMFLADNLCSEQICGVCQVEVPAVFTLRGLCASSYLDTYYVPAYSKSRVIFYGLKGTKIEFDESEKSWKMSSWEYETIAVSESTHSGLVMGEKLWRVYNEDMDCKFSNGTEILLTLSTCKENEFVCNDGSCTFMENRCDGVVDCKDESDELQCDPILIPESYDRTRMAPPKTHDEKKLKIELQVKILEVISIVELEGIFQLKFSFISTWIDKRLMFKNLQNDSDMNVLGEPEKVWKPEYILVNTNSDKERKPHGGQPIIKIIPHLQSRYMSDISESKKNFYFSGEVSFLQKIETYEATFGCQYVMAWYPFDIQICFMEIFVAGNRDMFVELVPDGLEYRGPQQVFSQYLVLRQNICSADVHLRRGIVVEFIMGRSLSPSLLSIYLPTLLINVIGKLVVNFL